MPDAEACRPRRTARERARGPGWHPTPFGWTLTIPGNPGAELEWVVYPAGSWIHVRLDPSQPAVFTIAAGEA